MSKTAIIYSFNTKKTGKIAERIKEAFGEEEVEMVNAAGNCADGKACVGLVGTITTAAGDKHRNESQHHKARTAHDDPLFSARS